MRPSQWRLGATQDYSTITRNDMGESMLAYEIAQLIQQRKDSNKLYLEFFNLPDLSMGLYVLPAGGTDPQSPHTEDEVYYVVSGRAQIKVAEEDRAVQAGSIVYVAKNVEHRFHSIEEELTVIVFFAPAEYLNRGTHPEVFKDPGFPRQGAPAGSRPDYDLIKGYPHEQ